MACTTACASSLAIDPHPNPLPKGEGTIFQGTTSCKPSYESFPLWPYWRCRRPFSARQRRPADHRPRRFRSFSIPPPNRGRRVKYQLLPPFLDRRPGNAAVRWNALPAEQSPYFQRYGEDEEKIWKWMEIPLNDPREKLYREKELASEISLISPGLFPRMEQAARLESCDWELPIREGRAMEIMLPDIQESRQFARLLAAKARLEIVEGKYDEAVRTLQSGYALARHVGQGGFLVCAICGLYHGQLMSEQVQQLIQCPDAPNLYWALSALPRPLVDFHLAAETESNMLYLEFSELRDLNKKKLSPGHWSDVLATVAGAIRDYNKKLEYSSVPQSVRSQLSQFSLPTSMSSLLKDHPDAQRYLIERGHAAAEVDAMPVAQIVLLYSVTLFDELSDDMYKWFFLPASEAGKKPEDAERRLADALAAKREIIPLAAMLLQPVTAEKEAETQSLWKIAVLRIFEAMRLHAANHGGRWPEHLADITDVPVPLNPYDGKPFLYERHGDKAIVTCSDRGPVNLPWRFEITFKPKPAAPTAK